MNPEQFKENIKKGQFEWPEPPHEIIQTLVNACLDLKPGKRPSAFELLELIDEQIYANLVLFRKLQAEKSE